MSLPFEIALRYLRRPTDRLISAVGIVSVLGLVIGVMALVISMALMTGYRGDLEEKLRGGNAEIFVYALDGSIRNHDETIKAIRSTPGVAWASPVILQQALVTSELHTTGEQVMLKAISTAGEPMSPMLAKLIGAAGTLTASDGTDGVSVGKYLAAKLKLETGSAVTLTVPTESEGSLVPRSSVFLVTHVFDSGFFEFDSRWIFLDFAAARRFLGTETGANLVEVKLSDPASLETTIAELEKRTDHRYSVTDWRDMNRQLFALLEIQQLVLFIVIGLIVFVSTFNIVSTLIMTAHEKRKEIGILLSMGSEQRFIRRIFIWYGTLVGVAGTAIGIVLGVAASWVITRYELISFGPEIAEVYFVDSIPFVTRWRDVAIIAGFSVVVAWLATLIPSARAARLNPIDALRYE